MENTIQVSLGKNHEGRFFGAFKVEYLYTNQKIRRKAWTQTELEVKEVHGFLKQTGDKRKLDKAE